MAKKTTPAEPVDVIEPQEITPNDSVVPVFLVPLTAEEEAERAQWAVEAEQRVKDEEAKVAHRESAIGKLKKLGLTDEEIAALTL